MKIEDYLIQGKRLFLDTAPVLSDLLAGGKNG